MSSAGVGTMLEAEAMLRSRIAALIEAGEDALDDFQAWFTEHFWDESALSSTAKDLAHQAELVFAEFSSGHWTWEQVTDLLRELLNQGVALGSLSTTERATFSFTEIKASAQADTQRVTVFS